MKLTSTWVRVRTKVRVRVRVTHLVRHAAALACRGQRAELLSDAIAQPEGEVQQVLRVQRDVHCVVGACIGRYVIHTHRGEPARRGNQTIRTQRMPVSRRQTWKLRTWEKNRDEFDKNESDVHTRLDVCVCVYVDGR